MKKLIAVVALASSMGFAYAAEPVALTDSQMDVVSAGAVVTFADSLASALGHSTVSTYTKDTANVANILTVPVTLIPPTFVTYQAGLATSTSTSSAQ